MPIEKWAKNNQYIMAMIRTFSSFMAMIFSFLVFLKVFEVA
jgi:hypothetical protein|tara:strand:- start:40569 stop:40691 length:123 start_codon:yes stop_codon:yes gene_type:complete